MDIQTFARSLATMKRKGREATLPFHRAYVKAALEQQTDLRNRWMRGHIIGTLECDEKKADRILSQSRTERTKAHQDAVKSASADFNYHVIRDYKPESTGANKSDPVARLVTKYKELTAAQKRQFLASI